VGSATLGQRQNFEIAASITALTRAAIESLLSLLRRFTATCVAVTMVALTRLAGFLGVVLVVARERVMQVNGCFDFTVLIAPDVALVTGIGLD
jgi:hypothetical protein